MKQTRFLLCCLLPVLFCVSVNADATSAAELIDFRSERWVRPGADVVEYMGRTCLVGSAYLPNIAFENGVIEFDLALDGSRGYPGVTFRATSPASYEHIYVRPHAGRRGDGLQYAPAFGRGSDWQLYNGPGYTSAVEMPAGEWIHVRIEVKGSRARVFFGSEQPALIVQELKHEPAAGAIGIRSARNTSAHFSNFSVTKTDDLDLGPPPQPLRPRGLVTEWELSQAFKAADVDGAAYPDEKLLERIEWRKAPTESNGLLNVSRHAQRSLNGESDLVFARIFLDAEQPETRRFSFGYSDFATVFLNGEPLFSGNGSYRARSPDYAGIISLEDMLHLELRKGRNELMVSVLETFGGWGLMGQDNDDDYFHAGMRELWKLEPGNRLPESVLYDPQREVLYVTHYFRGGNEYISRVDLAGGILEREWISGLDRPTGLYLQGNRLWTVDRRNLIEINIDDGKIAQRYPIPAARFPNDVTFDDRGNAYVSDTEGSRIYRFHDGEFEVWLEGDDVHRPNGMLVDGDHLLFGQGEDGHLKRVTLADRQVETLAVLGRGANVDGLRPDGRGNYVVSDYNGRVFLVTPLGEVTPLLDTTASGAKSADLEFVPGKSLLIVPGLFDNRLTAYHLPLSQ